MTSRCETAEGLRGGLHARNRELEDLVNRDSDDFVWFRERCRGAARGRRFADGGLIGVNVGS